MVVRRCCGHHQHTIDQFAKESAEESACRNWTPRRQASVLPHSGLVQLPYLNGTMQISIIIYTLLDCVYEIMIPDRELI